MVLLAPAWPAAMRLSSRLPGDLARWVDLPRVSRVVLSGQDWFARVGSRWIHAARLPAGGEYGQLATGTRFVRYRYPHRAGWQGWIENAKGEVVGWVTKSGQSVPHPVAERIGRSVGYARAVAEKGRP